MKAKISRGNGFRGVLNYVFGPGEKKKPDRAEQIGGNMSGYNPKLLSQEFSICRQLRQEIKNPCWHCSLTLPQGEHISREKWQVASESFLKKIGIITDKHQYTIIRHDDTEYDHVHLIVSRIALNGEMWGGANDVKKAILATQEIEKEMGLQRTKGFERKTAIKSLTSKEIQMSARTEKAAPRAVLQNIIKNVLKAKPDVSTFLEKLALAGVNVRPNIARTGRMNGFAFEFDGINFKGSTLGKDFTWAKLQKGGLQYEQDRDSKALSEAQERFDSRANPNVDQKFRATSGSSGERDQRSDAKDHRDERTNNGDSWVLRSGDGGTEENDRRSNYGIDKPGNSKDASKYTSDSNRVGGNSSNFSGIQSNSKTGNGSKNNSGDTKDRDQRSDRRVANANPEKAEQLFQNSNNNCIDNRSGQHRSELLADSGLDERSIRTMKPTPKSAWNVRFKKASAAKKSKISQPKKRVETAEIQSAKAVDPASFFSFYGYHVKRIGRQYSIRQGKDEYYRSTWKNGHWVHCDHYRNGIGDNIAMIQHLDPEKSFIEAVYALHGAPSVSPDPADHIFKRKKRLPVLPPCNDWAEQQGRKYLYNRGISKNTILEAEKTGFIGYTLDGVLCIGKDEKNAIRAIFWHAVFEKTEVQKRDLLNSDKSYAPILSGGDGKNKNVVIVEGVVDALAVHDLCKKKEIEIPTVIVTGSAEARGFLERKHIQNILKKAEKITVCYERERNWTIQEKTNNAHDKQVQRVVEINSNAEIIRYVPPEECKDVAEYNAIMPQQGQQENDYDLALAR